MIALVLAPIAVGLLAHLFSGRTSRALAPRQAVPLLTGLALTVALCTGIALSALAILTFAQLGPLPRLGHWSAPVVRARAGFPVGVGVLAAAVVAVCLGAALIRTAASIRTLVRASRTARELTPVHGDLVLVDDAAPTAYAVGGWPSRIVVSRSMLAPLSADERRVVLAHEASHVRHRHHVYRHVVAICAAANPLLRSTAAAIELGVERWADEDAAGEVRDRGVAARGLARAALAQGRRPAHPAGLAAADSAVAVRVRALLAPPPARRWFTPVLVAGFPVAALACWLAAALATWRTDQFIEIAERAVTRR